VLDFTSALYLGLLHPSPSLRPWSALTTGKPAALEPLPGGTAIAHALAKLQGCESAVLLPSTLHLFWDLFGWLARDKVSIYMDDSSYAIARWGVERAAARGVPVRRMPHHDPSAALHLIRVDSRAGRRPVIVADGFCPSCGSPAPISQYLQSVRPFGGTLVLDDTQALGIFGEAPAEDAPFGTGGGGSLRRQDVGGVDLILGSSLAKGFGVPLAVLSGAASMIRRFELESETRVHTSPPSAAVLHAAERALAVNRSRGDGLRHRLAQLVERFRRHPQPLGLGVAGSLFPVQTLRPSTTLNAVTLNDRLLRLGVRAVVHRSCSGAGARLSFLITTRHRPDDIDQLNAALDQATSLEPGRMQ